MGKGSRAAVDRHEAALAHKPGSAEARRVLSISLNKLGDFLLAHGQSGDAVRALVHLERSLQLREDLRRDNPGSARAARDLAVSHDRMARAVAGNADRREEALGHQRWSLELMREVAHNGESTSWFLVRGLAVSLLWCARMEYEAGHEAEAHHRLGEFTSIFENWIARGGALDAWMAQQLARLRGAGC